MPFYSVADNLFVMRQLHSIGRGAYTLRGSEAVDSPPLPDTCSNRASPRDGVA